MMRPVNRRWCLQRGCLLVTAVSVAAPGLAAETHKIRQAVEATFGDRRIVASGVELDLPPLAENGNSVPLGIRVDSPMTSADHVRAVHVFADANPLPLIGVFRFSPLAGEARVDTRIRLADSQRVMAVAEHTNGRLTSGSAEIIVTLAACITMG